LFSLCRPWLQIRHLMWRADVAWVRRRFLAAQGALLRRAASRASEPFP
jgi:hypothetical protein